MRATIVGALATILLSGVLENFNQLLSRDRHLMLTAEQVSLADSVRAGYPLGLSSPWVCGTTTRSHCSPGGGYCSGFLAGCGARGWTTETGSGR